MLDKIILFSIKNKLFVGFMTLMLIFWGVWSATRLPIDAVPDITNNQVQIITSTPTLASQEVEQLVTFPIEQAIANIPGLEETRSISRFGLSVITAVFSEDMDIYFARQLANEKLQEALSGSPPDEKVRKAKGDDGRYTGETLLRRARDAHHQPAVRSPPRKDHSAWQAERTEPTGHKVQHPATSRTVAMPRL